MKEIITAGNTVTYRVSTPVWPIYDYLWNFAYALNLMCVLADGYISVWGHAQMLRQFMETWREWYGETVDYQVIDASGVEHIGVRMKVPINAHVGLYPGGR